MLDGRQEVVVVGEGRDGVMAAAVRVEDDQRDAPAAEDDAVPATGARRCALETAVVVLVPGDDIDELVVRHTRECVIIPTVSRRNRSPSWIAPWSSPETGYPHFGKPTSAADAGSVPCMS